MGKNSIGSVIRQLMAENNLSIALVAERLSRTSQNIYNDLKRTSMKEDAIDRYANALGVDKQVIYDRWNGKPGFEVAGADLLAQQMERIEQFLKDQVEFQRQQIESQQRQIESQQRTIELLLGKSKGVSSKTPGSTSVALPATMYGFGYTHAQG